MANTIDVTTDYLIFDNTEAVTVTLKRAAGDTARSVTSALQRAVTRNDSQTAGVQIGSDSTVWHIANDELTSGDAIKEGDTITDAASVVWTVKGVSFGTFETRWRCVCVKQR